MGQVNITLANGQIGGSLQTNDGIVGMVLTGTDEGSYTLGTPILLTSLTDLLANGITTAGNPFAYRQVKEFYDEAGIGSQLYLMLVDRTVRVNNMADYTNPNGASILLDFAAGKIKVLGIMSDDIACYPMSMPAIISGLSDDATAAISAMQVMAEQYFNKQWPFRAVIGGTTFSGSVDHLEDESIGTTYNRVAILVGDTQPGVNACLGLCLGRIASIPVQRKISRVRTGSLSNAAAYVGTIPVNSFADMNVIAQRGYITFKTYPNVSGYFFSGDDTASATTDDYHFLSRGRVIDKAHALAYATFVQEVDDEILVNADGTLDAGFCKWLSQQMINQINSNMIAGKEISAVGCYIDPAQNILSTNQLNVILTITPVGYASDIEVQLGFNNPALS